MMFIFVVFCTFLWVVHAFMQLPVLVVLVTLLLQQKKTGTIQEDALMCSAEV